MGRGQDENPGAGNLEIPPLQSVKVGQRPAEVRRIDFERISKESLGQVSGFPCCSGIPSRKHLSFQRRTGRKVPQWEPQGQTSVIYFLVPSGLTLDVRCLYRLRTVGRTF